MRWGSLIWFLLHTSYLWGQHITSGGVWDNQTKKNHNMMAWPEGTNIASSGSGPLAVQGNAIHLPSDYKGEYFYTGFSSTIDFVSFKTAKLGSKASVKTFPQLKSSSGLTIQKWQKTKFVTYTATNAADGTEDFFTEMDRGNTEVLNSNYVSRNYRADKAKYKANVLEMIKKSMDDAFADYDAEVAEQT